MINKINIPWYEMPTNRIIKVGRTEILPAKGPDFKKPNPKPELEPNVQNERVPVRVPATSNVPNVNFGFGSKPNYQRNPDYKGNLGKVGQVLTTIATGVAVSNKGFANGNLWNNKSSILQELIKTKKTEIASITFVSVMALNASKIIQSGLTFVKAIPTATASYILIPTQVLDIVSGKAMRDQEENRNIN